MIWFHKQSSQLKKRRDLTIDGITENCHRSVQIQAIYRKLPPAKSSIEGRGQKQSKIRPFCKLDSDTAGGDFSTNAVELTEEEMSGRSTKSAKPVLPSESTDCPFSADEGSDLNKEDRVVPRLPIRSSKKRQTMVGVGPRPPKLPVKKYKEAGSLQQETVKLPATKLSIKEPKQKVAPIRPQMLQIPDMRRIDSDQPGLSAIDFSSGIPTSQVECIEIETQQKQMGKGRGETLPEDVEIWNQIRSKSRPVVPISLGGLVVLVIVSGIAMTKGYDRESTGSYSEKPSEKGALKRSIVSSQLDSSGDESSLTGKKSFRPSDRAPEIVKGKNASPSKPSRTTNDELNVKEEGIRTEPSTSRINESPRTLLRRGNRLLRQNKRVEAERVFRDILQLDPDDHHAMEGLVKILLKRKEGKEALDLSKRMVDKRPKRTRYRKLYKKALSLVRQGHQ